MTKCKKNELLIVSINVSGLKRKLFDLQFINYLKKFDIIFLQETWCEGDQFYSIKGYQCWFKNKVKMKSLGRGIGGICTYVRNHITAKILQIDDIEETLWVNVQTGQLNINICNVYRQPDESEYSNINFFEQIEKQLENVREIDPTCEFLIAGDWNARIGQKIEEDLFDRFQFISTDLEELVKIDYSERKSQDKTINRSGRQLLKFTAQSGLMILNGRSRGDESGEFTFISNAGSSVVDYMLASPKIFE